MQQLKNQPSNLIESNQFKFKIVDEIYVINLYGFLGRGTFGQVYQGFDFKNYQPVAIKVIQFQQFNLDNDTKEKVVKTLNNEIQNMKKIKNNNVVRLFDVRRTSNNLYLIQEYCNQQSLDKFIKIKGGKLSDFQSRKIINQILDGDLKLENILLHNDDIKIADFSFSKSFQENQLFWSIVGTPYYMSPQVLQGMEYSPKTDIWSLGVIFYIMLFKKSPFNSTNQAQLVEEQKNFKDDIRFDMNEQNISKNEKDSIQQMLMYNEKDRLSWETLFQQRRQTDDIKFVKNQYQRMNDCYQNALFNIFQENIFYYYYHARTVNGVYDFFKLYKYAAQIQTLDFQPHQIKDDYQIIRQKYQPVFSLSNFNQSDQSQAIISKLKEIFQMVLEIEKKQSHFLYVGQLIVQERNRYIFYHIGQLYLLDFYFFSLQANLMLKTELLRQLFTVCHLLGQLAIVQLRNLKDNYKQILQCQIDHQQLQNFTNCQNSHLVSNFLQIDITNIMNIKQLMLNCGNQNMTEDVQNLKQSLNKSIGQLVVLLDNDQKVFIYRNILIVKKMNNYLKFLMNEHVKLKEDNMDSIYILLNQRQ